MPIALVISLFFLSTTMAPMSEAAPCPEHPSTLAAMHDCYRPILLFAPSSNDPQLAQQLQIFAKDPNALRERNILVILLSSDHETASSTFLTHLPYAQLDKAEQAQALRRFHLEDASFTLVLIGKDGGEKMRSHQPMTIEKLSTQIDGMPMRQDEMKQQSR